MNDAKRFLSRSLCGFESGKQGREGGELHYGGDVTRGWHILGISLLPSFHLTPERTKPPANDKHPAFSGVSQSETDLLHEVR